MRILMYRVSNYSWLLNSVWICFLILLMGQRAEASRKSRITKVKQCQASIIGGDFSVGDELIFVALAQGKRIPIPVKIETAMGGKRYRGAITDPRHCSRAKGAKYSPAASEENLRDSFLYRQKLAVGLRNMSHKGLNVILGEGEQNLPSLLVASSEILLFPLSSGKLSDGFFERSIGFVASIDGSLPLLGSWEIDDGGAIDASWLSYSGGFIVRPFLLGAEHPSALQIRYVADTLEFKPVQVAVYQRSVLRSVFCGNAELALVQVFSITSDLSLHLSGKYSPAASCDTPSISEAQSLEYEKQQIGAGRAKDSVLSADQIESSATLINASAYGFGGGFRYSFGDWIAVYLEYQQDIFSSKIQLISAQRNMSFDSSTMRLGLDVTF